MSIVCLGEALVDLIARPGRRSGGGESFDCFFGGALANVAVAVARAGSPALLASATGEDPFGRFLRGRLEAEGVDTRFLGIRPEIVTPFAFVRFAEGGEPHFQIHGEGIDAAVAAVAGREAELAAAASAVVFGSNSMVGPRGDAVTRELVRIATGREIPVLFDPNLRLHRWPDAERAVAVCRELLPSCTIVKANLAEARLLVGDRELDAARSAEALAALGPGTAVVTAGARGAVARGRSQTDCPAPTVADPNPLGAGDAFMGTLVAALHQEAWDPARIGAALQRATAAAGEACSRIGATD